jgi:hypothetical protein
MFINVKNKNKTITFKYIIKTRPYIIRENFKINHYIYLVPNLHH